MIKTEEYISAQKDLGMLKIVTGMLVGSLFLVGCSGTKASVKQQEQEKPQKPQKQLKPIKPKIKYYKVMATGASPAQAESNWKKNAKSKVREMCPSGSAKATHHGTGTSTSTSYDKSGKIENTTKSYTYQADIYCVK